MQLEQAGKVPYLSAVDNALSRPTTKSPVEQTSENLSSYDTDENERARRAAARQKVQTLPTSERETFVQIFIGQHPADYKTTFNSATGIFLNLAEKIEFERWLERQFMQSGSRSTEQDCRPRVTAVLSHRDSPDGSMGIARDIKPPQCASQLLRQP